MPSERDLKRLADMVNRMGAVLTDLSATETAAVHALPGARMPTEPTPHPQAAAPEPTTNAVIEPQASAAAAAVEPAEPQPVARPTHLPRAVCMVGLAPATVPGLVEGLRERGYDVREFAEATALLDFLAHAIPGALLVDARKLRVMARVAVQYAGMGLGGDRMPAVLAVSPDGDLGHRLLAMRAGAAALFSAPVDSLRVIGTAFGQVATAGELIAALAPAVQRRA